MLKVQLLTKRKNRTVMTSEIPLLGRYFDHNATTPVHASVVKDISEGLAAFGNPSSIHWAGRPAKKILRESRNHLAQK